MKKGNLRFIPLQADLCLNKQKVDIKDFTGWQKCNAPVYGDCLSPLYKKNGDHHDIYIGDDYFDWSNGVLSKNGNEVLSGVGSKKIKKTKINAEYDSLTVSSDNILTWAKITSGNTFNYSLYGSTTQSVTVNNCTRIITVKAFEKKAEELYGVVVLYLHTSGKYGYLLIWNDNGTDYTSYGSGTPTLWTDFNVTTPLIQVAVTRESEFMVSFYADSGAELKSVAVKNIYIKEGVVYDNITLASEGSGTYYNSVPHPCGISVSVESEEKTGYWGRKSAPSVASQMWGAAGNSVKQTITVKLDRAVAYDITLKLWYLDATGTKQYKSHDIVITAGQTSYYTTVQFYYYCKANAQSSHTDGKRFSLDENGTVTTTTDNPPTGFFYYPTYDFTEGENQYSIFGYDYSFTTEEYPNDNTLPSHLVTKTGSVDNKLILGDNGYVCPGISCTATVRYEYSGTVSTSKMYDSISISDVISWLNGLSTSTPTATPNQLKPFGHYNFSLYVQLNNHSQSYTYRPDYSGWCLQQSPAPIPTDTTSRLGWVIYEKGYGTVMQYVKEPFDNNNLKDADCCMDDGRFYCSGPIMASSSEPMPTKLVALVGEFSEFDTEDKIVYYDVMSTYSVQYDVEESSNVFPKYYVGMTLSLSNYLFKVIYFFKAKADDTEYISIMINSLDIGEEQKAAHLYPGVRQGLGTNVQGSVKNTSATVGWRMLFNNNMLSNIGCYEKKEYIGTILCDWFTINEDFCPAFNENVLYYKDNTDNLWKLEFGNNADWEYKVIEDRYIVLNTTNYMNCYDTQTGLKRHFASDYNNRVVFGFAFDYYTNDEEFSQQLTTPLFRGLLITGQNANYEMTKDTITSIELGAVLYERCLKDERSFPSCEFPYGAVEGIDLYRGDGDSTSATYVSSFANGLHYINTDLINPYATYPIPQDGNIRYNPNLFTQIIRSYNNKDMVISDGIAYKLLYFNNIVPVMAFYLLDGVEEVDNVFVLQTLFYGASKTRLYQMNYQNGVSVEVVADITNMEYLGALPSQALFWSAQNRAIYSFQGNCIMHLTQYANEITGIYGKWYNPATQELFLDTNVGILVFSDLGTYCLEWSEQTQSKTVSDIFFFSDRFYINLVDDTSYTYYYSYNNLEGYESNDINILTKYYGNGLTPITVNNVYVRLYNQSVTNAKGSIVFKGHTITDIGSHTDTKEVLIGGTDDPQADPPEVAGEQWDSETDTMLVKYTPQYNRGLGFALEIQTTFPIIDIKFDYVEDGTIESQIAHINI